MSTLYLVSPLDIETSGMSEKRFEMIKALYHRAEVFCQDRDYDTQSLLDYSSLGKKDYQTARIMAKRKEWKDNVILLSDALFKKHSITRDLMVILLPSSDMESPLLNQLKHNALQSLVPFRKIQHFFSDTDPTRFSLNIADLSMIDENIEKSFFGRFAKSERTKIKGENAK